MPINFLAVGEVFTEFIGEYNTQINQYFFKGPFLGGKPAIFSKVISKFKEKVCLISCVSDDYWGNFIANEINKLGIDTSNLRKISDYNTPISFIFTDNNKKNSFFLKYTSATQIFFDDIDKAIIKTAKYFYISSSSLLYSKRVYDTIYKISNLIKHSCKIALSLGNLNEVKFSTEDKEKLQPFLEFADILFLNNEELNILYEGFNNFLSNRAKIIILKNSNIPYKLITANRIIEINPLTNLVNKNSFYANEVFDAGFLIGQSKGLNESLSFRFGSALLSHYILHANNIPTESELLQSISL